MNERDKALRRALCEATSVAPSQLVLADNDRLWELHDGKRAHWEKDEWSLDKDIEPARDFYNLVRGKGKVAFDLLINRPGEVLAYNEVNHLSGGIYHNPQSLASSIGHALYSPFVSSDRRYPFYWWTCGPWRVCYAMKISVAKLFQHAQRN